MISVISFLIEIIFYHLVLTLLFFCVITITIRLIMILFTILFTKKTREDSLNNWTVSEVIKKYKKIIIVHSFYLTFIFYYFSDCHHLHVDYWGEQVKNNKQLEPYVANAICDGHFSSLEHLILRYHETKFEFNELYPPKETPSSDYEKSIEKLQQQFLE